MQISQADLEKVVKILVQIPISHHSGCIGSEGDPCVTCQIDEIMPKLANLQPSQEGKAYPYTRIEVRTFAQRMEAQLKATERLIKACERSGHNFLNPGSDFVAVPRTWWAELDAALEALRQLPSDTLEAKLKERK